MIYNYNEFKDYLKREGFPEKRKVYKYKMGWRNQLNGDLEKMEKIAEERGVKLSGVRCTKK